ncbi:MAG: hypothetical protein LIO77_11070 [Rikenellaceae bacterium]|nr:hypothetical protein [Rikenellaceae bacterium]
MLLALIILYTITLVYLPITERFRNYTIIVALQGWILLGIALLRLHSVSLWEMGFVVAETLIFKAVIVPVVLLRIIGRTGINRIAASGKSQFNALGLSIAALVASIAVTYYIADATIGVVFFGVSLYGLLSGLILITVRKRIFPHMVGFLVLENGVFLFSMAVGVEMPVLINIAILLDILISVLMLGVFLTKIGGEMKNMDSDNLTTIKD